MYHAGPPPLAYSEAGDSARSDGYYEAGQSALASWIDAGTVHGTA